MRQDGWCPLDGMDLRHQGAVDQPRRVEQTLVVPGGVLALESLADGIVLLGEERVQAREAEPPVLGEARAVDALFVLVRTFSTSAASRPGADRSSSPARCRRSRSP